MGGEGLIMVARALAQYHALHLITLVLEVDIAQDHILLLQEGKVITLFPLEGKQNTLDHLDHQEAPLESEMLIRSADHILQILAMVLIRIKTMDILRNLHTSLRLMKVSGSHLDVDHRGHHLDPDLGQGLLICLLDIEDEVFGNVLHSADSVPIQYLYQDILQNCIMY